MERYLVFDEHAARAWSLCLWRLGVPAMGTPPPYPSWMAVRAARGKADHLPHRGFIL